jgi:hypothetical protein
LCVACVVCVVCCVCCMRCVCCVCCVCYLCCVCVCCVCCVCVCFVLSCVLCVCCVLCCVLCVVWFVLCAVFCVCVACTCVNLSLYGPCVLCTGSGRAPSTGSPTLLLVCRILPRHLNVCVGVRLSARPLYGHPHAHTHRRVRSWTAMSAFHTIKNWCAIWMMKEI